MSEKCSNKKEMYIVSKKYIKITRASAGNRTRIDCLEGNHANLYTTDALFNTNWLKEYT